MKVDSVGLVSKNPTVVYTPIVDFPGISLLVYFGAEYSRNLVLDDLEYSRRMNDHKVDVYACCGVAAGGRSGGRLCQRDLRIESAARYTDDSHSVIHLDLAVYVRIAVSGVTGNVLLEISIDARIYEQDSSLIRNFLVIKSSFACLNKISDVVRAGQSSGNSRSCVSRILGKTIIGIR